MSVIDNYINQYEKEYDFYKQLAYLGHEVLESEIINRGIKALVSNRAKRVDRLREKIEKRNLKKDYKSKRAIEKDIVDLAGVRVALYFPSEREIVGQVIEELFEIVETKKFPENPHDPKHNKRFSGYWATHYRVKLKKSDEVEVRFTKTVFEIQVASVLMHAWSEVEHDLVYKPFSGKLSEDELAILDEINGLVLAGEIALERLQKAITERTRRQEDIRDKYELTNFMLDNYKKNYSNVLNFGNTEYLASYLKAVEKINTSQIIESINNINSNFNESFSDQVLQNILKITKSQDNIKKYFYQISIDKSQASGYEKFTKTWIVFEKIINEINKENGTSSKKNFIPSLEIITENSYLDNEEISMIRRLRKVRNEVLHGHTSYSDEKLKTFYEQLKDITVKCAQLINDEQTKNSLLNEIE